MNIYLDEFDQEMKERGIRIVRYANDILIFARTRSQAGRYLYSLLTELEKSMWKSIRKRIKRFKDKIRQLTPRNHGKNIKMMVKEINLVIRVWSNYFKIANCKGLFSKLMTWIRRRLK